MHAVCAGGLSTPGDFARALHMAYAGVKMGPRFMATPQCRASDAYKAAIVRAGEDDIVLSERLTGVPVSLIRTPYIERMGLKAGALARLLLRGRRTKHLMRGLYSVRALWQLKRASLDPTGANEYWQAGKSVAGIDSVEDAGDIVRRCAEAWRSGTALTTRS